MHLCYEHVWRPSNPHFDEHLVNFDASLNNQVSAGGKVNFTVYYETLCPDCKEFISDQVFKAYQQVSSIMNLTMVPYGNAKVVF